MALRRILGLQARYLRLGRLGGFCAGFRAIAERALVRTLGGRGGRECPLCGWRGPLFLSAYYFDRFRTGAFCPGCGAAERHRTLKIVLERELSGFFREKRRRVLDVAPIRRARELFRFASVDYVSFDYESPLAQVHGDLRKTCFPDACFDFVLCYHVLEHIREERAAVGEIFRVLRPGGVAILQVPWERGLAKTVEYAAPREEEEGHVRRYGRDVAERWRRAGFQPKFSEMTLDPALVRRHGLEPDVWMRVSKP
ncbi:MAG: class I SAM-dependent methyltransferase [Planctomycetota bacterium]